MSDTLYVRYHDEEWGVPVHDDRVLFEMINLEGAQAGLSWRTVLHKRESYRAAFAQFDAEKMALFGEEEKHALLNNPGIIRNKLKIDAALANARAYLALRESGATLDSFLWQYVDGRPIVRRPNQMSDYRATSPESDRMSKDLKKRGFKFVGSTICYAFMQAVGMIDEHSIDCFRSHHS